MYHKQKQGYEVSEDIKGYEARKELVSNSQEKIEDNLTESVMDLYFMLRTGDTAVKVDKAIDEISQGLAEAGLVVRATVAYNDTEVQANSDYVESKAGEVFDHPEAKDGHAKDLKEVLSNLTLEELKAFYHEASAVSNDSEVELHQIQNLSMALSTYSAEGDQSLQAVKPNLFPASGGEAAEVAAR